MTELYFFLIFYIDNFKRYLKILKNFHDKLLQWTMHLQTKSIVFSIMAIRRTTAALFHQKKTLSLSFTGKC